MKKTINPEVRQELDEANWDDLLPRLLKYAQSNCRKIRWIGNIVADPEELVEEAIALAYGVGKNNGYRAWNKEKFPNLHDFLLTIINSIISHLNEHHNKFPSDGIEDQEISSASPNPEKVFIQKDGIIDLKNAIGYKGKYSDTFGEHTVYIIHGINNSKGIQIIFDVLTNLFDKLDPEFKVTLKSLKCD